MKTNKFTLALAAMGLISLASAAQAQTIIYLTGSTAARQFVYNALTTPGEVFTAAPTHIYDPSGGGGSDSLFAIEGNVAGLGDTIYNCSWTGSEAGIAAAAGQPLTQTLPNDPNGTPGTTAWALPGTPLPAFLLSPYTSNANAATHAADLATADTSQAVSRTPASLYPLHPFGIIGVIPFTYAKAYDSSPDAANGRLTNVPVNAAYNNLIQGDNLNACNYTGNTNDIADGVAMVGRNFGSGTRANELLVGAVYPIRGTVVQYAFGTGASLYPSTAPGTLTFGTTSAGVALAAPYAAGQNLYNIGNDGFDSGKGCRQTLQVDWNGQGVIGVGFLGLSDAKSAVTGADNALGHTATYLTYDGVYESDAAIISGAYPVWGTEWLYGAVTPSAAALTAGGALINGVVANLNALTLQTAGHDVRNNDSTLVLPTSVMQVTRSHADSGFPTQCAAGAF